MREVSMHSIRIMNRDCWDSLADGKRWWRPLSERLGMLVVQTSKLQHCVLDIDPQHKRFKVAYDFRKTVLR